MTDEQFQTQVLEKLDSLLFWLRLVNHKEAETLLKEILNTEEKILAYKMSDGAHTIEDIMKETGVKSKGTISTWWSEWLAKGLVRESPVHGGRKEKVLDLSGFDL